MKRNTLKKTLLTAGAVALLGSRAAFANSDPNTNAGSDQILFANIPGFDLYDFVAAKSRIGLDGNIRILWDAYTGGAAPTLTQSVVWVLDGKGNFLANSPIFPRNQSLPWILDGYKTNILIQGQKDGNTTILFVFFSSFKAATPLVVPQNPNSYAVITINAAGQVVSGVGPVGPFSNTFLESIGFDRVNGKIVVHWVSRNNPVSGNVINAPFSSGASSTHSAWVLNEFGGTIAAAGPFGFLNSNATINVNSNNQEVWLWDSGTDTSSGADNSFAPFAANTLAVWVVNPNGSLVSATQFGPF